MSHYERVHQKDPSADKFYGFDWSEWLAEFSPADTISTSTWAAAPAGLSLSGEGNTTTTTKVRVAGGTLGNDYVLTNRITTAGGQVDERSVLIQVRDK